MRHDSKNRETAGPGRLPRLNEFFRTVHSAAIASGQQNDEGDSTKLAAMDNCFVN
jgi:hypothetical protein